MSDSKRNDNLSDLFAKLCKAMEDKLDAGEPTASEMKVIMEFLKNNNITGVAAPGTPVANLASKVPFPTQEY